MVVGFELQGQRFTALNGGPTYKLTEAFSLLVECTTSRRSTGCGTRLGRPAPTTFAAGRGPLRLPWQINYAGLPQIMSGAPGGPGA